MTVHVEGFKDQRCICIQGPERRLDGGLWRARVEHPAAPVTGLRMSARHWDGVYRVESWG